jgi:hypothetical protein
MPRWAGRGVAQRGPADSSGSSWMEWPGQVLFVVDGNSVFLNGWDGRTALYKIGAVRPIHHGPDKYLSVPSIRAIRAIGSRWSWNSSQQSFRPRRNCEIRRGLTWNPRWWPRSPFAALPTNPPAAQPCSDKGGADRRVRARERYAAPVAVAGPAASPVNSSQASYNWRLSWLIRPAETWNRFATLPVVSPVDRISAILRVRRGSVRSQSEKSIRTRAMSAGVACRSSTRISNQASSL